MSTGFRSTGFRSTGFRSTGFRSGETTWIENFGNLRNTVRQELIGRQLANHAERGMRVLDVGCGQGTQAIRLAAIGAHVTGIEPSAELRQICMSNAEARGVRIELLNATIETLDDVLNDRQFDLVCAHGLLMYLSNRTAAIQALSRRVSESGLLSITFRNGHALAMRPGIRGNWTEALSLFETQTYVNELGVTATADTIEAVESDLALVEMTTHTWYGVRVFTDAVSTDRLPPDDPEELALLLAAEEEAGKKDPYRWMASQFHLIARHL
jgi:S-adenosylmethionine-dependent methyltransferase